MGLSLKTAATEPVLNVEDLEDHLRVVDPAERDYVELLATVVEETAEVELRRALLTQTWEWVLDAFPTGTQVLHVPRPPLQSVTSVKYLDLAGVEQTLAVTVYAVDIKTTPGRIALKPTQSWPSTYDQIGAITIEFIAGWASVAAVPKSILHGMKALAGSLYIHRESVVAGVTVAHIPEVVDRLWSPHKIMEF